MKIRSVSLASVTVALLSSCTVSGPGATVSPQTQGAGATTSPQTQGATSTTSQSQAEVDMCALVPVGDVQAHSPFTNPLVTAKTNVVPGACAYAAALGADPTKSGGIMLAVTAFSSPADAMTSHRNHEQDETDRGIPPQAIGGLGDAASAAGDDEVGVQAVLGNRVIDANLGGQFPDVSASTKVAAGTELVKLIISRLG